MSCITTLPKKATTFKDSLSVSKVMRTAEAYIFVADDVIQRHIFRLNDNSRFKKICRVCGQIPLHRVNLYQLETSPMLGQIILTRRDGFVRVCSPSCSAESLKPARDVSSLSRTKSRQVNDKLETSCLDEVSVVDFGLVYTHSEDFSDMQTHAIIISGFQPTEHFQHGLATRVEHRHQLVLLELPLPVLGLRLPPTAGRLDVDRGRCARPVRRPATFCPERTGGRLAVRPSP
jgi:hypothetical protein